MTIPDEEVALVRQATDMVALVGAHLALKRAGRRWVGLCPFHQEKTPSFSVNAEEGLYYCFGCQASGDAISFLREVEHLDFAEAVHQLARRANITVHDSADSVDSESRRRREALYETLDRAVDFYHERLVSSDEALPAREYLASRGYDSNVIERFRLGFSPLGFDVLEKALKIPRKLLADAGLGFVNRRGSFQDSFRGRLLFPIFDSSGRAVAMGGRLVPNLMPTGDAPSPKYRNSPETAIYSKRRTLYGLNWAKAGVVASGEIVVCEGYTDVIGCFQAGIDRAVATCGTALAEEHFATMRKFAQRIVLAYDADAAGQSAADRVYAWERQHDITVAVAALPAGSDPGELAQHSPESLVEAISSAQAFLQFRVARIIASTDLTKAEGRARAFEASLKAIAEHPGEAIRDQVLRFAAERTGYHTESDMQRARSTLQSMLRSRPSGRAGTRSGASAPPGTVGARGGRSSPQEPMATHSASSPPEMRRTVGASRSAAPLSGAGDAAAALPSARLEAEAIRVLLRSWKETSPMAHECLFASPAYRACFRYLVDSKGDIHLARQTADEETAGLLARLSVEAPHTEPQDIRQRLIDSATGRALREMDREIHMYPEKFRILQDEMMAVRHALEDLRKMREPELSDPAAQTLLSWLIERSRHDGDGRGEDNSQCA